MDAEQVEAGLGGEHDVAAQLVRRRLAERHAGGSGVGALEEQPLAVDAEHPVVHGHLPQPGADGAGVAGLVVDGHRDLQRGTAAGRRGPGATTGVGLSTPKVHSTELVPGGQGLLQLALDDAVDASCGPARCGHRRCRARPGPSRWRGLGSASRHSTRRRLMRTGPVRSMRTPRHRPPGFQVGSMQSQCWKTPVRLRLARRSCGWAAGDLDGEHVLGAEAGQVGDLVASGGRSSPPGHRGRRRRGRRRPGRRRRRARPSGGRRRARRRARSGCGRAAARRCSAKAGVDRQWPGTGTGSQPSSS